MWQPNRAQWAVIWSVAVLLILAWPAANGSSLGVKAINWIADPTGSLPALPPPLAMGLDDDGDAVTAHDEQEHEYYRVYGSSAVTRMRMNLKELSDPFDSTTERQLLTGLGILSALLVWRLNAPRQRPKD